MEDMEGVESCGGRTVEDVEGLERYLGLTTEGIEQSGTDVNRVRLSSGSTCFTIHSREERNVGARPARSRP